MTRSGRRFVARLGGDAGVTLMELLTAMVVMGIMMTIAVSGFVSYRVSSEHRGARDEVVSVLRNAAERALSEQRRYCVQFSSTGWTLYRTACSGATAMQVQAFMPLEAAQESLSGSFTAPTGHESSCGSGACAYFYPRGNSSDGSLTITRSGRDAYTVDVEGLTSRVSTSG